MLDREQREHVRKSTLPMQIITAALAGGVVIFAAIVLFLLSGKDQPGEDDQPFIAYLALGFAAAAFILAAVMPRWAVANVRRSLLTGGTFPPGANYPTQVGEVGSLMAAYLSKLIVAAALLEGAAFFNLTALLLEGQTFSLIAAGVLTLAILLKFPTRDRVESWVEEQLRTLQESRSFPR